MKKIAILSLLSLLGLPFLGSGYEAAAKPSPYRYRAYYQAGDVKVSEEVPTAEELAAGSLGDLTVDSTPGSSPSLPSTPGTPPFWDKILNGDWNTIVLVGEKVIEIIKANQAVVNVKRDVVHAMPVNVTDWTLLSGWRAPATKVYSVKMKNRLGMTVVEARVKVTMNWGGSAGGRGQYLANVTMVPTYVYASWGWNFDLWTENRNPVNMGSVEAPTAGLGFDVRYKAKTYLNELSGTQDFFLSGDGQIGAESLMLGPSS